MTIQGILAIIGSLIVILGGIVSIYRITKRIDGAIGLDSEGRTITERMSRVEHQLWPNGGSSLMDKVNNVSADTQKMSGELIIIRELMQGIFHK